MPQSRRRKKKHTGSGQRPHQPPAYPVDPPAPAPTPPTPPPASARELSARVEDLLRRRPRSNPAEWLAELNAVLAELEYWRPHESYKPPNYDHLPPLEKLVHPAYSPGATQYKGPWHIASQRATAAYHGIRAEVDKLGPRVRRDLADPSAAEPTDMLLPLNASPRYTYLATKTVLIGGIEAPDLYRYLKGNPEALERIEQLMSGRTTWVTPGYHWWMDRAAADTGRREPVEITLTVNGDGVAQLRRGNQLLPATPASWAALTSDALPEYQPPPPRAPLASAPAPAPVPKRRQVLRVLTTVFHTLVSGDFWILVLGLGLVVTIAVIIVMALLKL
ncbi:hypothetical protein ACFTSF_02100 [Kribbella sp. NPDC056951]|uniref:hypothetical protein n=1 Tax=Kribbella sp. NPDC056951 TaxID=3345978 RepID=UPI00362D3200